MKIPHAYYRRLKCTGVKDEWIITTIDEPEDADEARPIGFWMLTGVEAERRVRLMNDAFYEGARWFAQQVAAEMKDVI